MPSQLVDDVRALIRARVEEGRPLTDLERAFILSATANRVAAGTDVVDELEAAIAEARRVCLSDPPADTDPTLVAATRRHAVTRLLAAARHALDYDPLPPEPRDDDDPAPVRPHRLDVDGYRDDPQETRHP